MLHQIDVRRVAGNEQNQFSTRRRLIVAMLAWVPAFGFEQPKLGDEQWIRQLHRFVQTFNGFLSALDDGRFDLSKWEQSRSAWSFLEVEQSRR